MKKYFVVVNNDKIIAYHDEKYVVKTYVNSVLENNHLAELRIGKLEKYKLKKIKDYQDLYLVKYGHSFIQMKYFDSCYIDKNQFYSMYKDAKDTLITLIECIDDGKEIKVLSKAVDVLDNKLQELEYYVPSYSEACNIYERREMCKNIMSDTRY